MIKRQMQYNQSPQFCPHFFHLILNCVYSI
nr:MAG TPA: hypothetical protein [Caudoviricetes sp.]